MDKQTAIAPVVEEAKKEVKTLAEAKGEQDKIDLRLKQQEEETKARQQLRAKGAKKLRMGESGKRSLMTSGFKGIADKPGTLG